MHLANFNPKGRVMFQDNDLCKDWRQKKPWSDWVEARDDPWDRGGYNNIEKSDLFSYLGDPIRLVNCRHADTVKVCWAEKFNLVFKSCFCRLLKKGDVENMSCEHWNNQSQQSEDTFRCEMFFQVHIFIYRSCFPSTLGQVQFNKLISEACLYALCWGSLWVPGWLKTPYLLWIC